MESYFDFIPLELNVVVVSYLNVKDLNNLEEISPLCKKDNFWEDLFIYKFNKPIKEELCFYKIMYKHILNYMEMLNTSPMNAKNNEYIVDLFSNYFKCSIKYLLENQILLCNNITHLIKSYYNNDLDIINQLIDNYILQYHQQKSILKTLLKSSFGKDKYGPKFLLTVRKLLSNKFMFNKSHGEVIIMSMTSDHLKNIIEELTDIYQFSEDEIIIRNQLLKLLNQCNFNIKIF